jgi:hypothetical protein
MRRRGLAGRFELRGHTAPSAPSSYTTSSHCPSRAAPRSGTHSSSQSKGRSPNQLCPWGQAGLKVLGSVLSISGAITPRRKTVLFWTLFGRFAVPACVHVCFRFSASPRSSCRGPLVWPLFPFCKDQARARVIAFTSKCEKENMPAMAVFGLPPGMSSRASHPQQWHLFQAARRSLLEGGRTVVG